MKNSPAFRIEGRADNDKGLSKLEYAAIEAMKGVLSDSKIMELIRIDDDKDTAVFVAGISVECAHALLNKLEGEQ